MIEKISWWNVPQTFLSSFKLDFHSTDDFEWREEGLGYISSLRFFDHLWYFYFHFHFHFDLLFLIWLSFWSGICTFTFQRGRAKTRVRSSGCREHWKNSCGQVQKALERGFWTAILCVWCWYWHLCFMCAFIAIASHPSFRVCACLKLKLSKWWESLKELREIFNRTYFLW